MSMSHSFSRRRLLAAAGVAAVPISVRPAVAGSKARSDIKLGMATGLDAEPFLRFLKQIGVEWIATSLRATQGSKVDPALTRGAVLKSVEGAMGGIGGPPGGPSGPWKEAEVRQVIQRVEAAGLKLGNLMLHA